MAVIVTLPAFPAPVLSAATTAPAVSWTMRAWRAISPPRLRPTLVVKMPLFAPESVTMSVAVMCMRPPRPFPVLLLSIWAPPESVTRPAFTTMRPPRPVSSVVA